MEVTAMGRLGKELRQMVTEEEERMRLIRVILLVWNKDEKGVVIDCADETEAFRLKNRFYAYFRLLEKEAELGRGCEKGKIARKLLKMKEFLALNVLKEGKLRIRKRQRRLIDVLRNALDEVEGKANG